MQVIFHLGPHKTGTTSIQQYLLDRYGSDSPQRAVWYPRPEKSGPGHSHLASTADKHKRGLSQVVAQAQAAGVEKLLLSAEGFVHGHPEQVEIYGEILAGCDTTMVTTQTAPALRVSSLWQEMIKQRSTKPLDDSIDDLLAHPALSPDILGTFATSLHPKDIAIVYVDPSDPPDRLITNFLVASKIKDEAVTGIHRNKRLGFIEAELLRRFNELTENHFADEPSERPSRARAYVQSRDLLLTLFRSERWEELVPREPIPIPPRLDRELYGRTRALIESLERLKEVWAVEVIGSPKVMTLGLENMRQESGISEV